jgi:uncharacterized Ntn-hydrolase superfamily protein
MTFSIVARSADGNALGAAGTAATFTGGDCHGPSP